MRITRATLATVLSTTLLVPAQVLAFTQDPSTMSDEEKMEVAKQLYGEGDSALQSGDAATALAKFEEAYNTYAPSVHLFNFNIASAAYELGDCAKAKVAYQRFLDLVPDHPARGDAQEKLLEIERSGCASAVPEPATTGGGTTTTTSPIYEDNEDAPELTSKRSAREDQIEEEIEEKESKRMSGMMIAGVALTAAGGAGLVAGAIGAGLANKSANDLAGLASPGPTGFPDGNYSDENVFDTDRNKLPTYNRLMVAGLVGGGVLTAVGVTLIILDVRRKKKNKMKSGDKNASTSDRPHLAGFGPGLMRGGAGASAMIRF